MVLQGFTCSSAVMLPGIITRFVFILVKSLFCDVPFETQEAPACSVDLVKMVWVACSAHEKPNFFNHLDTLPFLLLKPGGNFWFGFVFSYRMRDGGSFPACVGTTSIRMLGKWREGGFGLCSGILMFNNCCVFNLHGNFW